jgi:hypothetical protein
MIELEMFFILNVAKEVFLPFSSTFFYPITAKQCCGTETIFYGSGSDF